MTPRKTSLQGSYFELLKAKYPDLADNPPRPVVPAVAPKATRRRRRSWVPLLLLLTATASVLTASVALRPASVDRAESAGDSAGDSAAEPSAQEMVAALLAKLRAEPAARPKPASRSQERRAPESAPAAATLDEPPAGIPSEVPASLEEPWEAGARLPGTLAGFEPPVPLADATASPSGDRPSAPSARESETPIDVQDLVAAAPAKLAEPRAPVSFQPARKLEAPAPEYPERARRAGEEGAVVVEATVDARGRVTETRVVDGRSPMLDRAAAQALGAWRFAPATRDGVAVTSSYRVSFEFHLRPETEPPPVAAASRSTALAPLEVGGEVKPPRRLVSPLPVYPDDAWAEGVRGDVLVRAVIDERGQVAAVEVLRGLPFGITEAAVDAIRRWRFAPATRNGEAVAVYHNLSVRFET